MSQIGIIAQEAPDVAELKNRLTLAGHTVVSLSPAQGLMTSLSRWRPDLILVADDRPAIDPATTLGMAKMVPSLAKVPFVLFTHFDTIPKGYEMAAAVGAEGSIARSWSSAQMVAWTLLFLAGKRPMQQKSEPPRAEPHGPEPTRPTATRPPPAKLSPPTSALDDVIRLAAALCLTPIALLSLPDEQRQLLKARGGFGGDEELSEDPFRSYTLQGGGVLEICDTTRDSRCVNHPLVLHEPKLRFYAGVPLVLVDGRKVGTLCVMDRTSRRLANEQRDGLMALARLTVLLLNQLRHS